MMNFKGLSKDVEIRAVTKNSNHAEDIVRAYNLKMDERLTDYNEEDEDDEDDELDITVPIVEMTYEDSDDQEEEPVKEDIKPEIKIRNSINKLKDEVNGDDEKNL